MLKKLIGTVLVATMGLGLVGCSGGSNKDQETSSATETTSQADSKKDITVRIALTNITDEDKIDPITGIISPGKAHMEKIISDKTGYNIEIIAVAAPWIQQMETLMQSGKADLGKFTNQVQVCTWLDDLTDYIEKDEILGNGGMEDFYLDYAQHYMKYSSFDYPECVDNIYGLPLSMTHATIVYDSLIFEQWGVEPPKDGDSLETILEIAKKVNGTNPVTGEHNYGMYIRADRSEFDAIQFNALKPVHLDDMDISKLDKSVYVEGLKDSKELLNYFNWLEEVVKLAPEGITTNSGNEKWLTKENNIAINISPTDNRALFLTYYRSKVDEITDRFKWISFPTSQDGMQGFPELQFLGISQQSKVKDAAWEVLRTISTDPDITNEMLMTFEYIALPTWKDTSKLGYMKDNDANQKRYDYQSKHGFITDDYTHFRLPIQPVIAQVLAKQISPEEARTMTYEEVKKWVDNKEKLKNK